MKTEVPEMEMSLPNHEGLRLVRIDLRPLSDGTTLAITPSGRLYRIDAPPGDVDELLQACDGTRPLSAVLAQSANPSGSREVIEVLRLDGCLRDAGPMPAEDHWIRFDDASPDLDTLAAARLVLIGDEYLISMARRHTFVGRLGPMDVVTLDSLHDILADSCHRSIVVVALRDRFDSEFLLQLSDLCQSHGVRWTQFHLDGGRGWLGPSVAPGRTPDYRDLLGRRLAAAESAEMFQALTAPSLQGRSYTPPVADLTWMLSMFLIDVERWLASAPARTLWHELEADPVTLSITSHPVLPLPHRQVWGDPPRGLAHTATGILLDERTGVINSVRTVDHHPSVPSSLTTVQSYVARMTRLYHWSNNKICGGSSFKGYEVARDAAIGEAVERYCGNWLPTTELINSSFHRLEAAGEHAVNPHRLVLYSESQYAAPGFPFVPFTSNLDVFWTGGQSLTAGKPAWIPASLVYGNWYTGPYAGEPPTNFFYFPGLAAGPTLEAALASGVEEIIERHATILWWLNRQPLPAVAPTPELQALWEGAPTELGQRAWLIHLDNEFDVPVMAGVLENVEERLFTIGFAARPDPIDAAYKAWTEALTLQEVSRDLDDPNGPYREQAAPDEQLGQALKPWRADRAYLDDYRPDFRDVTDLLCQGQIFLDPRAREIVRPWVDVDATRRFDSLPRLSDRSLSSYRSKLEDRGYEIFFADLTTPDVAATDMKVVRVVVPGLVPNFPAAFPFLGRGRIQRAAVEMGWRRTELTEEELNYFPLPHA